jgi:hypothetical protein
MDIEIWRCLDSSDCRDFIHTLHRKRSRNTIRKVNFEEFWVVLHSDVRVRFYAADEGNLAICFYVVLGIVYS